MSISQKVASGIKSIVDIQSSLAQSKAAYRFLNNDIIDIQIENEPIIKVGIEEINKLCGEYCLVAHDWSDIDYKHQNDKKELLVKRDGRHKIKGYELQSSLAISDLSGEPISPLVQNIKTSTKIYSTYNPSLDYNFTHLEELHYRIKAIRDMNINKRLIHIIDREADSVGFLRDIKGEQFLIRIRKQPTLYWVEKEKSMSGEALSNALSHKKIESIVYQNQKMYLYGVETKVKVIRKQTIDRVVEGKRVQKRISGEPIEARFISVKLIDQESNEVSKWLLLSNANEEVSLQQLIRWYYYRWNIESYFKLLKSSGHHIESWQQKSPQATFRRLIIASYACTLVWKLAHTKDSKAKEFRELLVKLSGRQLDKGKEYTYPSLLAGFWVFLSMVEFFNHYDYDTLIEAKSQLNSFLGVEL